MSSAVGVVIATRERRGSLLGALERIVSLPERPSVVVVDNASGDDTVAAVRAAFPAVEVVPLPSNRGVGARNVGAARLDTPFVAFSDDDSWWEPGALSRAADSFRRHPDLGLLAARILVGEERRLDPTSAMMEGTAPAGMPGPRVDGFLACGAVLRRSAFLATGGFCERFVIGGEEELLAIDLRAAGWRLCYVPAVVAVHDPERGDRGDRSWLRERNALWTSWLRKPAVQALAATMSMARAGSRDRVARRALLSALRGLPWVLSARRPLP